MIAQSFFDSDVQSSHARCVTPKRVHRRVIAPAANTAPFEEMSKRWGSIGNTVRFDWPEI